jgi:endonuclease/exonuclease/phosphatase family metal-dependent hydrolase
MPPFPKPRFEYDYDATHEISALRQYVATEPGRAVPAKAADRLLLLTWNVANLGVQRRRDKDYRLLAEVISWFDVAAIQECHDNLAGIQAIKANLPDSFRLLYSDASGNNERLTYLFDADKVGLFEEVGEVALPPSDYGDVKLPGIRRRFDGFDRNPYLATFRAGAFTFSLVNVHLYYGSESTADVARRCLETFAVALWANRRRRSKYAFMQDILPLGDFNLPKVDPSDPVYRALTRRGLHLPEHSTKIGSSIASDHHYDQIAFFPGHTKDDYTGRSGVIDFDGAVFRDLWQSRPSKAFAAYVRYYLSDHRPLWAEFRI